MENKKTKKELESVLNQKITENTTERRENEHEAKRRGYYCGLYISMNYDSVIYAPINGYKLKELPNNKPLTLLKAKEENAMQFVAFANIKAYNDGSDWITFFDITEEKKTTTPSGALPHFGYAMHDARKDEGRLFIVLNKNINSYKIALAKHYQRAEQYKEIPTFKRWNLSAASVEEFDRRHYYALKSWHRLKAEELDKNGYYLPLIREQLKQRADQIRADKKRAQEEQRRAEFLTSDKSHHIRAINDLVKVNKNAIIKLLSYDKIMTCGALSLLSSLKENIQELEKIGANFDKYARYDDPEAKIQDDVLNVREKYLIAITKYNNSALDWCSVGCYQVRGGEVVARYDWIGQPNTCHAGEVTRCAINLKGF